MQSDISVEEIVSMSTLVITCICLLSIFVVLIIIISALTTGMLVD